MFSIQTARKIKTAEDGLSFIRQLESLDRESVKRIVLDCPATMAREIIMKHVQTVMLGKNSPPPINVGLTILSERTALHFNRIIWGSFENLRESSLPKILGEFRGYLFICSS